MTVDQNHKNMHLVESDAKRLKGFLIRQLEPITDAAPDTLADYVIALLKHDKDMNALQSECKNELKDFISGDADGFVRKLFDELRRSYSPPDQPAPRRNQDSQESISAEYDPADPPVAETSDRHPFRERRRSRSPGYRNSAPYANGERSRRSSDDSQSRYRQHYDHRQGNGRAERGDYGDQRRHGGGYKRRYEDEEMSRGDYQSGGRGGYRGGGRGGRFDRGGGYSKRGRRDMNGGQSSYQQQVPREPSNQLTVVGIPEENCTKFAVHKYFSRFGSVTSIRVDPSRKKAVLTYQTVDEAHAAISSVEAPFGNRFIKIFWFKESDLNDMTEETAPVVPVKQPTLSVEETRQLKEELQRKMEVLQKKQEEERLKLMEKLNNVDESDRQEILNSLGRVSKAVVQVATAVQSTGTAPTFQTTSGDKTPMEVTPAAVDQDPQTQRLLEQLEAVKAEHDALGLGQSSYAPRGRGLPFRGFSNPYTRGGPRGRGVRGRGRGRGGASMSLDLRPKSIKIEHIQDDSIRSNLKSHFEQFPGMIGFTVEDEGRTALIHYSNRWQAEQAMSKGGTMIAVHQDEPIQLQMGWFHDPNATTTQRTEISNFQMTDVDGVETAHVQLTDEEELEDEDMVERSWKR